MVVNDVPLNIRDSVPYSWILKSEIPFKQSCFSHSWSHSSIESMLNIDTVWYIQWWRRVHSFLLDGNTFVQHCDIIVLFVLPRVGCSSTQRFLNIAQGRLILCQCTGATSLLNPLVRTQRERQSCTGKRPMFVPEPDYVTQLCVTILSHYSAQDYHLWLKDRKWLFAFQTISSVMRKRRYNLRHFPVTCETVDHILSSGVWGFIYLFMKRDTLSSAQFTYSIFKALK